MEKPNPESFKQLTISVEKLPASTGQHAKISSYATARARLLLGCYRTGDANDPETYVAAIAATLARYSEQIITDVTHPVTGLPTRLSWLPTVKEVFDACEVEAARIAGHLAREKRIREQLAERAEADRLAETRPTAEQLREKYGQNWGLSEPPRKPSAAAPSWDQIVKTYAAEPGRIAKLMYIAEERERLSRPSTDQHSEAAE